jgi:hypothetical protein
MKLGSEVGESTQKHGMKREDKYTLAVAARHKNKSSKVPSCWFLNFR